MLERYQRNYAVFVKLEKLIIAMLNNPLVQKLYDCDNEIRQYGDESNHRRMTALQICANNLFFRDLFNGSPP